MKPFILAATRGLPAFTFFAFIFLAHPSSSRAQRASDFRVHDREVARVQRDIHNAALEQQRIVVKYEKNNRGEYVFTCENRAFCSYIVEVSFSEFENLQSDIPLPARMTVPPGMRQLFILRKSSDALPAHFRYRHTSFRGCLNPKPDTTFPYLLPVPPGRETRISELTYLAEEYGGESTPKGWYALSLHVHSGDTLFAARKGRVIGTRDHANLQDSAYTYAKEENFIEICHDDCTFARYSVFRDSGIFVQPGDWVEAGQPLGIAGGEKYAGGPQVRFAVRYNMEQEVLKDSTPTGKKYTWAYISPQFWTKENGKTQLKNHAAYTSEHPATVITQEMSKKETRKWLEAHKNG